ncbi:hypothetical protein BV25DRAFT_1913276 [Artomyces pyxidatus]|uniref:Uncharacterized protein n=1 Tax=Artomyces pyxidatus TaxID=48021 RepID=A0ACB8TBC3_9AGAM|nr:hypothetical protein BV25DRAFT_1913276 [Artomyces pyxidatus]
MANSASQFWSSVARSRLPLLDELVLYRPGVLSVDMTSQRLDEELKAIQQVFFLVKACRNALAGPIMTVPPELMSRIFFFAAAACPPKMRSTSTQKLGWINVTHVCRRWREIALGHSTLWNVIDYHELSRSWIEVMLKRSATASLHVVLDLGVAPKYAEYCLTAAKTSRIRSLELRSSPPPYYCPWDEPLFDHTQDVLDVLSGPLPMPVLQSLKVSQYEDVILNLSPFIPYLPQLTRLSLNNCLIPLDSAFLPNLVYLRIHLLSRYPGLGPCQAELSAALSRMTRLQTLKIAHFLGSQLPEPCSQAIYLPSLTKLVICGVPSNWVDFVCSFHTSPDANIELQTGPIKSGVRQAVLRQLLLHYGGPARRPRTLILKSSPKPSRTEEQVLLGLSTATCDNTVDIAKPEVTLKIIESAPEGASSCSPTFGLLTGEPWQGLHLDTVEHVYIRTSVGDSKIKMTDWPPSQWLDMFLSARQVTFLRIADQRTAVSMFEAMTPANGADPLLFPNLERLSTCDFKLDADAPGREPGVRLNELLETCLQGRNARGSHLRELGIREDYHDDGGVERGWAVRLQSLVDELYFLE